MDKILIEVSKHQIVFSYCDAKESNSEFSSITKDGVNRIITTANYISTKLDLFVTFINQTNNKNKIEKIYIDKFSLTDTILGLFKDISPIPFIHFNEQSNLPLEVYEKIKDLKIEVLECYSMPKDMFEELKQKGIDVQVESTLLFNSRLMNNNNFQTYADLYNKEEIDIDFNRDEDDLSDLDNFLKVNQTLHTVNIKKYYDGIVQNVLKVLIQNKEEEVTINIYEHDEDIIKEIPHLKKIRKKIKSHINLRFIYSSEYKKKRFKKRILIFLTILIIIGIIFCTTFYFIYN